MVENITINGKKYECIDPKKFRGILIKNGLEPTMLIQESVDPEIIRFLFDGAFWYVAGKLIDEIIEESKDFLKPKEPPRYRF